MNRIAVLVTCHNRCAKTLRCLEALFSSSIPVDLSLHAIVVDDGSTDGTSEAVRDRFPSVEIIKGNGALYWNKGMHRAFARAIVAGFDGYLWLNDDTILYPDAISRMTETWRALRDRGGHEAIVVGSTHSAADGRLTYGGLSRPSRWVPLKFELVEPGAIAVQCETMNGNCVLISNQVAAIVGNLNPEFAHAMGDIDYGLRAGRAGIETWVVAGYAGTCERNADRNTFRDPTLSTLSRLERMLHAKGLPPSSWWTFTRLHGGGLWPLFFVWPYLRVVFSNLLPSLKRGG